MEQIELTLTPSFAGARMGGSAAMNDVAQHGGHQENLLPILSLAAMLLEGSKNRDVYMAVSGAETRLCGVCELMKPHAEFPSRTGHICSSCKTYKNPNGGKFSHLLPPVEIASFKVSAAIIDIKKTFASDAWPHLKLRVEKISVPKRYGASGSTSFESEPESDNEDY